MDVNAVKFHSAKLDQAWIKVINSWNLLPKVDSAYTNIIKRDAFASKLEVWEENLSGDFFKQLCQGLYDVDILPPLFRERPAFIDQHRRRHKARKEDDRAEPQSVTELLAKPEETNLGQQFADLAAEAGREAVNLAAFAGDHIDVTPPAPPVAYPPPPNRIEPAEDETSRHSEEHVPQGKRVKALLKELETARKFHAWQCQAAKEYIDEIERDLFAIYRGK